jgi:hypothetical protein
LELIGADGLGWTQYHPPRRGLATYYNLLHPRVQQAMLNVCQELLERYRGHPALAGLAIDLSAEGYALLPGADCGYDDATMARFQQDHPQLRVPGGSGVERFAARARYLTDEQRIAWVSWRAAQVSGFYLRLHRLVADAAPSARLYLATGDTFSGRQTRRQLRPALPRRVEISEVLLELGISTELANQPDGPVLLRPNRIAPLISLDAQADALELNQSVDLDEEFQQAPTPASLFFHPPQEARLESFDKKGPFKNSYTWLVSQPSPSQAANRQRFAHALATLDSQVLFDGGWLLPLGQEAALASLRTAYRGLPAQVLPRLAEESQPVVMRAGTVAGRTCFYAVNDSPWSVTATVDVALPPGCQFQPLDESRTNCQLVRGARGGQLRMELEPYDMVGGWFSAPRLSLARPHVDVPAVALAQLESRLQDFSARCTALTYPKLLGELPVNRDFEAPLTSEGTVPGWSTAGQPGTEVHLDAVQFAGGNKSLRLLSTGPEAWIRSDPIPSPKAGRLAISMSLRVADAYRQPQLRLAAEWQADGQIEYRYAALGRLADGQLARPVPTGWQQFVFMVPDLPGEGVSELRARLDLMGPGEVWVDDVQLFEMVFDEEEHIALVKLTSINTKKLYEGKVADCQRFLDSYWPRFLAAHVPLINDPATAPDASRPTAQTEPPAASPPVQEAKKPGFFDRLKGIVPERLRF